MMNDNLTCLIPTHNRPHFLRRLFHFYQQHPPGFRLMVVDSSNPAAAAETAAIVKDGCGDLRVGYRHFDLNMIDKCVEALKRVESPFVIFCADDDFLLPNAVWKCVDFLDDNPGYESAIGWMTGTNVMHSYIPNIVHQGYSIEDERAFDRCRKLADFWFTNFYGVYRTNTLCELFQLTADCTDSRKTPHLAEQMLSLLSVLRGRVKVLPLISSVCECHGKNSSMTTRTGMQTDSEELYLRFRHCVTNELARTGVLSAEAEQFLDGSYGHFRDSNVANRRRRRSILEQVRRFLMKASTYTQHYLGLDYNRRIAVKRLLRASDYATAGPALRQAHELIREFPYGIPTVPQSQRRSA